MPSSMRFGPWCGAVTSSSATVKAGLALNTTVSLVYGTGSDAQGIPTPPTESEPAALESAEISVATFMLEALTSNTQYYYALKINGAVDAATVGRFHTFPLEGSASTFKFATAGDASMGSNHRVFDEIREAAPLFFLHLGDLHYGDTDSVKVRDYRSNYARALKPRRQADLFRSVSVAYAWDDHDFCGDNSDGSAKGRAAACRAYRQCVPHYPLLADAANPGAQGDESIHQAFTVGRVRVLVLDTRSRRDKVSMLGAAQKQWLLGELLAASDQYRLTVIHSSVPWLGRPTSGKREQWWHFSDERDEIGGFIESNDIRNVCMISGDAHMLAIDDGSLNSTIKTGGQSVKNGVGRFPTLVAAPLDRNPSTKGGDYSAGKHDAGAGQYALVTVVDDGGPSVRVIWEGKSQEKGRTIVSHSFVSPR